jgi:hypothetical protein
MCYQQLYIADRRTDDIYIEDALRDENAERRPAPNVSYASAERDQYGE